MNRAQAIVGVVLAAVCLTMGYTIFAGSEKPGIVPLTLADDDALVCRDEPTPELEQAACAKCPPGQPKCIRDRDCDAVCGGRVEGACAQINSCIRCCLCAT